MDWLLILLFAAGIVAGFIFRPIEPEDRALVLRSLSAGEMSSSQVMAMTGLSPSTGYAILYGFEHRGIVTSRWQPAEKQQPGDLRRRMYALTLKGEAELAKALQQ